MVMSACWCRWCWRGSHQGKIRLGGAPSRGMNLDGRDQDFLVMRVASLSAFAPRPLRNAWGLVENRQELHRYSLDEDAFALFCVTSAPQVLVQRRQRGQGACRAGQENEDVQVERQHWLAVEGGAHGAADGVAADDAIALECIRTCTGRGDKHRSSAKEAPVYGSLTLVRGS